MKTILVPVDFSRITGAVVKEAASLARALSARVLLFAVVQPPVFTNEYGALMGNLVAITNAGKKNAERQLDLLVKQLDAASIKSDSKYVVGAPIGAIVGEAKKLAADYIVMGSHGHTALYDLIVGSTTHGVLMRASCPVVIVPSGKKAKSSKPAKRTAK